MMKIRYSSKVFISDRSQLKYIFQTVVMTKGTNRQKHNFVTINLFCEQGSIVQIQVLL